MDDKTKYPGIRIRGKGIQLDFRYKKYRCREMLKVNQTPSNIKKAANLLGKIKHDIAFNIFNYANYFPNSKNVSRFGGNPAINFTIRDLAYWWLERYKYKDIITKNEHESKIRNYISPKIGHILLNDIVPAQIEDFIDTLELSTSTKNNTLTPLRLMFEMAYKNKYIKENIMNFIDRIKRNKKEKNPFTIYEIDKILSTTKEKESKCYYQFAFWTGLSSGEQVALKWGDINFDKCTASINKILTRGENKGTKGDTDHRDRDIELVHPAYQALIELMPDDYYEDTEKYKGQYIFLNPSTGEVWTNYASTERWKKHLKEAGVPYRKPYDTRHAYASIMLTACLPDAYLRSQMGHATMKMLESVYGKFHNDADVIDWVLKQTSGGRNGAQFTKLFLDLHNRN